MVEAMSTKLPHIRTCWICGFRNSELTFESDFPFNTTFHAFKRLAQNPLSVIFIIHFSINGLK